MTKMKIYVTGKVAREIIAEGETVPECVAYAKKEWAALTGGNAGKAKAKLAVILSESTNGLSKSVDGRDINYLD